MSCSRATAAAGGPSLEFAMNVKAQPQIVVVTDAAALAETAARRLIARVTRDDRAAVCLTGGSSPLGLYRLLAQHPWREQVPWDRVHWFMGDDRFVPESDQLSNMGAARRAFLDDATRAAAKHSSDCDRYRVIPKKPRVFTKTNLRRFTARTVSTRRSRCLISC